MEDLEKQKWIRQAFAQYEGRLLRYVMKFTHREMASEIVQESFLKLLKQEHVEKIKGHELPWLFRVCRNSALDRLKKEKPMNHLKECDEIPYEGEMADQKMERQQRENKAAQILKNLNPTQREVVRLKFQEELSYKEISEVTGHSVSHVGVHHYESIKKLRDIAKESQSFQLGGQS